MRIAAVIGNYQGEHVLPDALASLAAQTRPPDEVLVVDAGSRDRSAQVARAHAARVLAAPNGGIGSLYNAGARATDAELVLLANNDVSFEERCLELLERELLADERRFAADPQQLDWAGGRVIHARSTLRRGPLLRQPLPGFVLDQAVPAEQVVPTVMANGAALLVRRERLLALGGFDERFWMEFEDLDLSWRAWLRGWEVVHVPEARLRHHVGKVTTPEVLPRRLRSAHHNLVRFALKCLPAREAGRVLAGELLRLPAHPRAIAPALLQVAGELPELRRLRRETRPSAAVTAWLLAGQKGARPAA